MENLFQKTTIKIFTLVTVLTLIPSLGFSQGNSADKNLTKKSFSDGLIFSGAIGYNNYYGDLTEDLVDNLLPFNNQAKLGFGLGIHKEFLGFLEIGIKGMIGKVEAINSTKRPNTLNEYSFNSNVNQVGLNANLNLVNLLSKRTDHKFAFLISGGYGISAYNPESSVTFPGGESIEFPENVNPDKSESATAGTINYGVGMRYMLTDNWAVGVEANMYNLSKDNLDSWTGNSSFNDKYSFVGVSINYILGKKKSGNAKVEEVNTPVLDEKVETLDNVSEDAEENVIEEKEEPIVKEPVVETIPVKKEVIKEEITTTVNRLTVADFKDAIIYFDHNENQESTALNKQINTIAQKLNKFPNSKIVLAGYTDKSGTTSFNQKLSEQRATWVKSQLISKYKIEGNRISTVGKGMIGSSGDLDPSNRKVEVIKVN